MIADIRVKSLNGYGVMQEYSVDLWQGYSMPSVAYMVIGSGRSRHPTPIRRGTKVYERVIMAAKATLSERRDIRCLPEINKERISP